MKIGVLSDTHDNLSNLLFVLETCRKKEIDTVVHCGDLTGLDMVSHLKGFRVIFTMGNMDTVTGTIMNRLEKMRDDNFAGPVFRGSLDGVSVAAVHSHVEGAVMGLVQERKFKWIFHGHTHQRRDEVMHGARIINPGALGGLGKESRSFCMVDLETDQVEFIKVK